MGIKIAYSTNQETEGAVKEIKEQINISDPRLIIFFSSSNFNQDEIADGIKKSFKDADVIGCSSSGELTSGKMLNNSIVLMAFDKETVNDVKVEVIKDLKGSPDPQATLNSFEKYYKTPVSDLDFTKYFGIILIDGLSGCEEKLMEQIGTKANISFVGGSAGDDLKFKTTFVNANGISYTNAAVLALIKSNVGFDILKTQSFTKLNKIFVATSVNENQREILELDGKNAIDIYSEAVGVAKESAASKFMSNPLGVLAGDEPFVRSPQQFSENGIKFFCNVAEGTELTLLESTNIVKDTQSDLDKKIKEFGKPSGLINFNCILRTLELQNKNQTEAYGAIFKEIPTIGFSTYGEEYIGHINQTSVMILFK
ncbi:MAG: FIST N-terminal domain-containing protein [Ignavibacteriaceae bacterium]